MWRRLLLFLVPVIACSSGGHPRLVPDGGAAGSAAGAGGMISAAGTGGMISAAGTGGMVSAAGAGGMVSAAGTGGGGSAATSGAGTTGGGGIPGTGSGLEVCYSVSDTPPFCGAAKCGNGMRDSCGGGTLFTCPPVKYEECDGLDLRETCETRGYGAGVLSCRRDCTIDDSACRECPAVPAAGVTSCNDAPVDVQAPAALGIAATDAEVGLAWVGLEDNDKDKRTLTFARLSSTLDLLGRTDLEDKAHTATPLLNRSIMGTSVAPLASGWVVAAAGETEVFIHALGAQDTDLGRTSVAKVASGFFKTFPADVTLVPRTGGGPLLIWSSETAVRAALVAADGRSTTTPFTLPLGADTVTTSPPSGVFVGDSFYVVYGIRTGAVADAFQLVRVRTTGSVVDLGSQVAAGESPTAPSLVTGASELRVTYVSAVGPGLRWMRLGLAGEELSQSALISQPEKSERSPAVAFGDDAIVLRPGTKGTSLTAVRVSKAGLVIPIAPIARTRDALEAYQVVRSGPGVVAAWLATRAGATSRIGLARVVP